MYGAIIGDFVGSIYEGENIKTKEFPFFQGLCDLTDDSYMTIAVAQACNTWYGHHDLEFFQEDVKHEMRRIGNIYPNSGYGESFFEWLRSDNPRPYYSYGNGSAMRVSPCGFVATSLEEAEALAKASALPTHNHPEGIKGAQAVAAAVYMAFNGYGKKEIRAYIREKYYPLDKTLSEIRPNYSFEISCQGTVPQAIQAFLESTDFEDAIRNAVSLGGDCDTLAAITGGIAEAYYGIPKWMLTYIELVLNVSCHAEELNIISRFRLNIPKLCIEHGSNRTEQTTDTEADPNEYLLLESETPMKVFLIERELEKFKYLQSYFAGEDVVLFHSDFENFMKNHDVECVVSPANAFGLMDGGYDLALTEWYGNQLQDRVQQYIVDHFRGEQPIGTSFAIETRKDGQWLIHTPTMRTPQPIVDPRIIYQCMRTTLMEAERNHFKSILIPMFGGTCGRVKPEIVAKMMWKAYHQIQNPPEKIDWDYAETVEMLPEEDFRFDEWMET